ncbi:hypothetical protein KP79_PYT05415 [Mizuhopecten yessoensis]|uniref:Uncharacterized protein n=1 Tax=Mizuhopecten yessoensis TaxID=6573 RepID=A0A210PF79_MIZYE|nr:hypothetical protein KP79_PYT05415 [Mizuhopecten yessoensis]
MSHSLIWIVFNSAICFVAVELTTIGTITEDGMGETFLKVDDFSEIPCEDKRATDSHVKTSSFGRCEMYVNNATIDTFVKTIEEHNYKFIHISLRFNGTGSVNFTKCVIQPQEWVWTFPGHSGGTIQYLHWPTQYSVWSLGLLTEDVLLQSFPVDINMDDMTTYPVVIGQMNTTVRIARALTNMVHRMIDEFKLPRTRYRTNYFCYKSRILIRQPLLYMICHHVLCPVETIGYSCCHVTFSHEKEKKPVTYCSNDVLQHNHVWRVFPIMTGLVLFLYFPIFLFQFCSAVYDWIHLSKRHRQQNKPNGEGETMYLLKSNRTTRGIEWLSYNPISIWWIFSRPVRHVCEYMPMGVSRLFRFMLAILSVSVIVVKIVVHGIYQKDFVIASVRQGSPMDFLSVLAGYELGKKNFMPDFGGPLIATGFYIVGVVLFMCIPKDLSKVLGRGLPQNTPTAVPLSPLFISVGDKQRLTSFNIETKSNGYSQLSTTMVANFFLLLNPSFVVYVFKIQLRRLKSVVSYFLVTNNYAACFICISLVPCYIAMCVLEIFLCLIFYGMPMLMFMFVIVRAYCTAVWNQVRAKHVCWKCVVVLFLPQMVASLTFVVYMLNIVFVDSFLFLSRVAIFAYTGMFAYTTLSSGYLVLGVTVFMYIGESIHKIKTVYTKTFRKMLELCKIHDEKHESAKVYALVDDVACIPSELFMDVVHKYQPLRVQLFKAVMKITIIVLVLYISVELLVSFEKFRELSTVTQAVTTLLVCAVPKFIRSICKRDMARDKQKWKRELSRFITDYCRETDVLSLSYNDNGVDILVDTL